MFFKELLFYIFFCFYFRVEEYWEPKIDGLEKIIVKREIPVIHIFLSTNDIQDQNQIGFVLFYFAEVFF